MKHISLYFNFLLIALFAGQTQNCSAAAIRILHRYWPAAKNAFKSSYESFLAKNPRLAELFFSPKAIKTNIAIQLSIQGAKKGYNLYQEQYQTKPYPTAAVASAVVVGAGLLAYGAKKYFAAKKIVQEKGASAIQSDALNFYKGVLTGDLNKLNAQGLFAAKTTWETIYKPQLNENQNRILAVLFNVRKKSLNDLTKNNGEKKSIPGKKLSSLVPAAA